MINIDQLRKDCIRLFFCETINDSIDLLDVYSEFLFRTVIHNHKDPTYSKADADAKMVIQMMLTKTLHLKNVVSGFSYKGNDGTILDKIIDPTIVASSIRNIYETVGMFNLIYRFCKTEDEKTILYNLWVHSGLQYRQRFESIIRTKESAEKLEDERKQIRQCVKNIESTSLFKQLNDKDQKKIHTRLKEKEYLVMFENNKVSFLHWQELTKVIGVRNGLLDNIYTYFSLYSHPSNVSVFQFANMFSKDDKSFLQLTNINLKYYFCLTSVFIADYIHLSPKVLETFESLSLRDQIVINFHNTYLRDQTYSINDAHKVLD